MSDLDLTHTILVNLQSRMAALHEDMAAMRNDVTTMRNDMNTRFDAVEGRLEHLEHHAVVTNSKLDMLTKRVEHLDTVCEHGWAQATATATFSNRFAERVTSELAELRARVEKLESKDPPTRT
jgi:outer membrane murein-binding lipoprotein Lpp